MDGGEKLVGHVQFKRQFKKEGVDEQLSVRFFVAGEREGTRMELSPGQKVSECCNIRSFAVLLGLEC